MRVARAFLGACSVASCGGGEQKACTAIGWQPNGVTVKIQGVSSGARVTGDVCVAAKCTTVTEGYRDPFFLFVQNPGIQSTGPMTITVRVRDAAGRCSCRRRA